MANPLTLKSFLVQRIPNVNVYLQPPSSLKMSYPAIICSTNNIVNTHAGDSVYKQSISYTLTVITDEPFSDIPIKVSKLPYCSFDRHYISDNLYHDIFTLYY